MLPIDLAGIEKGTRRCLDPGHGRKAISGYDRRSWTAGAKERSGPLVTIPRDEGVALGSGECNARGGQLIDRGGRFSFLAVLVLDDPCFFKSLKQLSCSLPCWIFDDILYEALEVPFEQIHVYIQAALFKL